MDAMPATPAELCVSPRPGPASKMRESADISKIAPALVNAQAVIENPARNRDVKVTNKDGKSYTFRYATLDAINEATRHALAENGLCVLQPIVATERGVSLVTRLLHESGQWMECDIPLAPPGPDPKAFGSAVTYLRRYAVSAMLNVSPDEDDDASAASGSHMEDHALHRDTSQGRARNTRQADARPRVLTDGGDGAGDPVQALTDRARAARSSIEDGQALLDTWHRHAAALEQHRGSTAWQAMERELGKGLQRSLGPILSTAFTTALHANDAQHIAVLRRKWDGEWAKTLRAVEQQAPAIHAALTRHVTAQATRVRNAQRQLPQEPHGPSVGKAGDDAPEPGTDAPADRSDAIMAAHGQDGAPD